MFVTEDGNTRGRATLRDGHIAVGDVVRYGPCFCFFFGWVNTRMVTMDVDIGDLDQESRS